MIKDTVERLNSLVAWLEEDPDNVYLLPEKDVQRMREYLSRPPVEDRLSAEIWQRDDEWVLEISGSINDTNFTCRHTEPLTTAKEDVAGLPSLYAALRPAPETAASDDVVEAMGGVMELLAHLVSWSKKKPDDQPHFPNGMRPFSTGDLAHYIKSMTILANLPKPTDDAEPVAYRYAHREGTTRPLIATRLPDHVRDHPQEWIVEPVFTNPPKPTEQATSPAPDAVRREAYDDGWSDGYCSTLSDRHRAHHKWENSFTKARIDAALASSKPTGENP